MQNEFMVLLKSITSLIIIVRIDVAYLNDTVPTKTANASLRENSQMKTARWKQPHENSQMKPVR